MRNGQARQTQGGEGLLILRRVLAVDHVASDLENAQLFGAVPGGIGTEPFMRLFTLANTGGEQVSPSQAL